MIDASENTARDFLELASHQRLSIILSLRENKSKVSIMARELDATNQEVSRNFDRLTKAGLIKKEPDGYYQLSTFGKSICTQIPAIKFLSENKKYFEKHDFTGIPLKFVQRIGALSSGKHIKGFVKVQEKWNSIYKNSQKHIYNILTEVSYSQDIIDVVESQLKNNVNFQSILSEEAIVPQERKKIFEQKKFQEFIKEGTLQRKMREKISAVLVVNEKEACISFSSLESEPDLSQAFYSDYKEFHEWCLDYFRYCWYNAHAFSEKKLQE